VFRREEALNDIHRWDVFREQRTEAIMAYFKVKHKIYHYQQFIIKIIIRHFMAAIYNRFTKEKTKY
jgi:hypothetical protein